MNKLILTLFLCAVSLQANADSLSKALTSKMDYLIARQNVVSGNIANASTPGYLAQDIVYAKPKSKISNSLAMRATSNKHISPSSISGKYKTTFDKTFIRNDGNSVRLDDQMLKMAKIQQDYVMATRLFTKHMAMQKLAVQSK